MPRNKTMRPNDPHQSGTFADFLVGSLHRWSDRIAFDDLEHQYSYRYCADMVSRIMAVLARDGGVKGRGVGLLTVNSPFAWMVAAAIKISGGYMVALPFRGSPEDLSFFLTDGLVSALVVHEELAELGMRAAALSPNVTRTFTICGSSAGPDIIAEAEREGSRTLAVVPGIHPDDIVEIKYTGGTTGVPKGAAHTHWSMTTASSIMPMSSHMPLTPRYLAAGPMSHSGYPWMAPVLNYGGTIVMNPMFEPDLFISTVETKNINLIMAVPTMIYKLLDIARTRQVDFSSIERFIYSAAPMSVERLGEAIDRFGLVFTQIYGTVEHLGIGTALPAAVHSVDRPDILASCGLPMAMVAMTLLDDDGQEVANGATGEICLRTPAMMKEYFNRPDETEKAFAGGWMHTGDLATRDDCGYYTIVDRKKDVIVTGGFNVFSPQVEAIISAHPKVSMVAIIGVPDETWGEAVKAVVVPVAGETIDPAEIFAMVREKKGSVSTPKTVDIVASLPLTNAGKINKRALRENYWPKDGRRVA